MQIGGLTHTKSFSTWATLGILCCAFGFPAALRSDETALEILETNGISPDAESLGDYLDSLRPDSESARRVLDLIQQLGHKDFHQREAAMTELVRTPVHSAGLLQKAIEGDDPEIAWRAKQVLKLANGRMGQVLSAVFSVIEAQSIPGLAESIIESFAFCTDSYLKTRAAQALKATVTVEDAGLLAEVALAESDASPRDEELRIAAISALEASLGDKADPTLARLVGHEVEEAVRMAACRALANHGNKSSLPALVALLESEDVAMRTKSARILQSLTGRRYEFLAYEEPSQRAVKVLAWKRWLEEDSPTALLRFPLKEMNISLGRTLFANYSQKRVYELGRTGKLLWEQEVTGTWAVQGLQNGHRLVASYTGQFLVEYDASGQEVWRFDQLPGKPYSVQRLSNGNTLVPCYGNKLIEIHPVKGIIKETKLPDLVKWAERLENGLTLVVFYTSGKIAELDADGKIVWEVSGMRHPYSVQRLPNGNTLVANRSDNRAVEVDRTGKVVWSYVAKPSLYRAQRLPGGNTLLVTSTGAVEVDPQGNVVWERAEIGLRGIDRY